ncbi:IclR family transcriptional regulator [Brevibacterium aurantiacum]|uniref:IclR family transcriptional regulator n=1 Tax=Brevibacterium aurantiacum TaxID=273384 RepID=A0A4Z0KGE5_BREAU|nr:IclR family transcriptional regulator [Brevibacterium aurantiacum]TGD37063.1 IclR family transcriptional regulator [Brevibacterium aurantiacum]
MIEQAVAGANEHRTVSRVTGILEFVARSERRVRMADIVKELDAPRSSVHGLVRGLVSTGYLHATDDGRYTIGAAISALIMHKSAADKAVREAMESLNLEFDETVALVAIAGDSIVTTDAIESSMAIRYNPTLGLRRPLYPTSAGKCFLANAASTYRDKYLERNFTRATERDRVRDELLAVRRDGFAVNCGDTLPDLHAVSVPIFDGPSVNGVITIAGPSSRFTQKRNDIVHEVRAAAERASRKQQAEG